MRSLWAVLFSGVVLALGLTTEAQTFTTLYQFQNLSDGAAPTGNIVFDAAGNLYGTAQGGSLGYGEIYEISSTGDFSVLYAFPGPGWPVTGLGIDSTRGILYGTTQGYYQYCPPNCGGIFQLEQGQFSWLRTFAGLADGGIASSPVAIDRNGTLYGTTYHYGPKGWGTVWRIQQGVFRTIHAFSDPGNLNVKAGAEPWGNLAVDASGTIYGVTLWGSTNGVGAIYKLTPQLSGSYTISVPHVMGANDTKPDQQSHAGMLLYGQKLIGTEPNAGVRPFCGVAYKLTPKLTGGWTKASLVRFNSTGTGENPEMNPIADAAGNLYGTTDTTVYELSAQGSFTVLRTFADTEGTPHIGGLAFGPDGALYGTTMGGGTGAGTVWKITF